MRSWKNTEEISRKLVLEAHLDRNALHGDLLKNRFHHMMKKLEFPSFKAVGKAELTPEKQFRCADAQWATAAAAIVVVHLCGCCGGPDCGFVCFVNGTFQIMWLVSSASLSRRSPG